MTQKTQIFDRVNIKDSESESQKTKDPAYVVDEYNPKLSFIQEWITQITKFIVKTLKALAGISEGTSNSDKIVRLVGALIKLAKTFQFLHFGSRLDKTQQQIAMLRRLLRMNRITTILKEYVNFALKKGKKLRDFYEICFKTLMLVCDINDCLVYLMQMHVIKQAGLAALRKNVANIYFLQCVIMTLQHIYDYFCKDSQLQRANRRMIIIKFIMDTFLSHNDFSGRKFVMDVQTVASVGVTSSVMGLVMIMK